MVLLPLKLLLVMCGLHNGPSPVISCHKATWWHGWRHPLGTVTKIMPQLGQRLHLNWVCFMCSSLACFKDFFPLSAKFNMLVECWMRVTTDKKMPWKDYPSNCYLFNYIWVLSFYRHHPQCLWNKCPSTYYSAAASRSTICCASVSAAEHRWR